MSRIDSYSKKSEANILFILQLTKYIISLKENFLSIRHKNRASHHKLIMTHDTTPQFYLIKRGYASSYHEVFVLKRSIACINGNCQEDKGNNPPTDKQWQQVLHPFLERNSSAHSQSCQNFSTCRSHYICKSIT